MYFQSINGVEIDQISASDRGLAYGDGLFTTAKILNGNVLMLKQHIERLRDGCIVLSIDGVNFSLLEEHIIEVAKRYPLAVLKVIITSGAGGRGYSRLGANSPNIIVKTSEFPTKYTEWQTNGICIADAKIQLGLNPLLAGIKHLNRLEQVLLRAELDRTDYDDLLVYDLHSNLVETTCSNVFWFENKKIFTPIIKDSGVAGLFRSALLKAFPEIQIVNGTQNTIKNADAMFITNSVMEIVPIKQYQGMQLNLDKVHQIQSQFKRLPHD